MKRRSLLAGTAAFLACCLLLFVRKAGADNLFAPTISENPQNFVYANGDDAVYSVSAGGKNLTFDWILYYGKDQYKLTDPAEVYVLKSNTDFLAFCDDVIVESGSHHSQVIFVSAKYGIDSRDGEYTRVVCMVSNETGMVLSTPANVRVETNDPAHFLWPPRITVPVRRTVDVSADDVPRLTCDVKYDEHPGVDIVYQWYRSGSAGLETILALPGEEDPVLLLDETEPGTWYYTCLVRLQLDETDCYNYSSPILVEYYDSKNVTQSRLDVVKPPDQLIYTIGDMLKPDGLRMDYYDAGAQTWERSVPVDKLNIETTKLTYTGQVYISVEYEGLYSGFYVTVNADASGQTELPEETESAPTEAPPETMAPPETPGETEPLSEAPAETMPQASESVTEPAPDTEPSATVPEETKQTEPAAPSSAQETSEAAPAATSAPQRPSGSGNGLLIAIIILMALLLAALIVLIVILLRKKKA